jgi:hypothetical protein
MKGEMERKWRFGVAVMSLLIAGIVATSLSGCGDDYNSDSTPTVTQRTYALAEMSSSGISGTVTFRKQSSTTTLITIQLTGTQSGEIHPAHIHANTVAIGGGIVLDLTNVNGTTGKSETVVTELNDGTPVTYETLIGFNGYAQVHKSAAELGVVIANGNIGSNGTPIPNPVPNPDPY